MGRNSTGLVEINFGQKSRSKVLVEVKFRSK